MEWKMSDIQIVRLTSGEELIADVIIRASWETDGYLLSDVAIIIPTQQNQLGLAPFMAYGVPKDGIFFKNEHIMFLIEPVDGLRQQYQTMFGKVITPATSIISWYTALVFCVIILENKE